MTTLLPDLLPDTADVPVQLPPRPKRANNFWERQRDKACLPPANRVERKAAMNVAALIPAYREERFIADVVRRARQHVSWVLVIDDGSDDGTAEAAQAAGAEVIIHPENAGKGNALQTGLRDLVVRGFEYIMILDADGQHLPEEIPRFLEAATSRGTKLIVGNRMHHTREMPWNRRWTNRFMSSQISLLCGQRVPDTQCGFRLIHRDLVPRLLGNRRTGHFQYETEMLVLTSWSGQNIGAVPVSTVYGEETSSIHPVQDALRFFKLMARYWVKRVMGGR